MPKASIGFIFLFILFYLNSSGQSIIDPAGWKKIDSAIHTRKNLQDVEIQIRGIKTKAIAEHNDAALARCFVYLLMIEDQKTEDSLFFRNAAFMDSILNSSSSSALLKSIMHLLLARRINEFIARFEYKKNKNLIRTGNPSKEYALMERKELDSLITEHLDKSISISKQLDRTNVDELLWLSSDLLIFLFKPNYTDLLYGERISMFRGQGNQTADYAAEWLSESQDAFIQHGEEIKTFNKNDLVLFRYYHEWIQYHISSNREAAYFIETLARKFFYHNLAEDSAGKAAYENYLSNLLLSPYPPVTAHAVYQLCKIWYEDAAKYNPTLTSHIYRYGTQLTAFDSIYRLYYNKILQLLNHFETQLDSFSYIKTDLLNMRAGIMAPDLIVTNQDVQIPDSAIPVLLKYRNISHLYTRIIRISPFESLVPGRSKNISRFLTMPVLKERDESLILPDDHQWHNTFLTWDPLTIGRYIVLYSDTSFSANIERIHYIDLSVTHIAVINNDHRVFVLNRKTGFPLQGARVLVSIKQKDKSGGSAGSVLKTLSPKIVNEQGYVMIPEKDVEFIDVYSGNDSITSLVNEPRIDIPDELYNKDRDDDLADYYEDNIRLNIFTDRAIYRPGQTVFFKGIFTVPDPKTGELRVLDFLNLRFPFFENLFYKTVLKFKKLKTNVTISDPFNRTVDTFRVTPNKFGSFSGSYLIPKDAATGEWDFDADAYDMDDRNSGRFHVEEYKRPGFKLTLIKPKTELQLGDSLNILVKVRSFAGAPLNQVRIRYQVSRYFRDTGDREIMNGESSSNEHGEFNLGIRDSSLHDADIKTDERTRIEYTIHVEALDQTGENHEEELRLDLSNRPVNINFPVPEIVEKNSIAPVYISMTNEFSGPVKKSVEIFIYRMSRGRESDNEMTWPPPDLWIENQKEWQKKFPYIRFDGFSQNKPDKKLIYITSLSAEADKKFTLPADSLATGFYRIELVCRAEGRIIGEASKEFSVYDEKENSFPGNEFESLPVNTANNGDTLKLISGNKNSNYFSIYHMAYRISGKNGVSMQYDYVVQHDKKGLNEFDFRVPSDIAGNLTVTHLYIMNNRIFRKEHRISIINKKNPDPDIIIEKYRTQISPGERETFVVSIKTKNPQEAVELMTTMYDASLDQLEPHKWEIPREHIYYNSGVNWNPNITYIQNNRLYENEQDIHPFHEHDKPLWWISSPDLLPYKFTDRSDRYGNMGFYGDRMFQGQVYGLSIQNSNLNDVVVIGYGVAKRDLTGVVTKVVTPGIRSLSEYVQPMIILDGVLYTGDINKISPSSISQGIVLKGADAAAIYGNRAAQGVLILSTHGPIILPPAPEMPTPPLVIRKNFEESAFFYPMIYAGKDGMYSITFTLPESVTEWKWKLFAHTRKAGFAYLEKSLFSQLPLMVQPSMPRFLYQGDKIVLKTRITNLDTTDQAGQLKCTIEDLVTGENINSSLLKESGQSFSVKHESNTAGNFELSVPPGFLHPLRIRISAATNKFSDGEEHIIPILSRKFLLTRTTPVKSEISHTSLVTSSAFPEDAEPYGLSLYINPKPQATLMNALSYLAFDPYGCSEQTLNKMLAYSMAIRIARMDSLLRQGISKIPNVENTGNKNNNEPEPDEQTMPWLQLSHVTMIQQQKLKQLFDSAKSKQAFEKQLTELMAMQNPDGGMGWFKGGRSDDFISAYVLAGLGKMHQDALLDPNYIRLKDDYPEFLSRLIDYVDKELATPIKGTDQIDFLYARSYWLTDHPVTPFLRSAADSVLKIYWNSVNAYSLDQQATLITISLRFAGEGDPIHEQSLRQLESIRQLAISDSSNGVRWKAYSNSDDLDRQDEEAVARIAEAFETSGTSGDVIPGIVKWLLKTRNEHVWTTTKSTAAIIGLLQSPDLPGVTHQLSAKVEDSILKVSDDLFAGRTADFLNLSGKKFPSQISVSTVSPAAVSGSIKYYYFSSIPPDDSQNAIVQVHKTLYRYENPSGKWELLNESSPLQISDKIKTVLTIITSRQLNYVFINERRAATMEPRETESGYKYEDGLDYYKSVKDAGYLLFVDKIPSGIHSISYETVVSASGSFTNGPASLQCMYQPSINAYSNSTRIIVTP